MPRDCRRDAGQPRRAGGGISNVVIPPQPISISEPSPTNGMNDPVRNPDVERHRERMSRI